MIQPPRPTLVGKKQVRVRVGTLTLTRCF